MCQHASLCDVGIKDGVSLRRLSVWTGSHVNLGDL